MPPQGKFGVRETNVHFTLQIFLGVRSLKLVPPTTPTIIEKKQEQTLFKDLRNRHNFVYAIQHIKIKLQDFATNP